MNQLSNLAKTPKVNIRKQLNRFDTLGDETSPEPQYVCFPGTLESGREMALAGSRHALCKVLKQHGIVRFDASFVGGGDSGYFESVCAYDNSGKEVELPDVRVFRLEFIGQHFGWAPAEIRNQVPEGYVLFSVTCEKLREAIESVVWTISKTHMGWGWENNDGGSGEIRFDVVKNRYCGDTVIYYTESEHNEIEG